MPLNESVKEFFGPDFLEQAEQTVAINPLMGLQVDDLLLALHRVAREARRHPGIFLRHFLAYQRQLVKISGGKSSHIPSDRDRRFDDPSFQSSTTYKGILQAYLALSHALRDWVDDLELSDIDNMRASFVVRLLEDALAPTNFLLGNPAALKKAASTKGGSLLRGARNFARDLRHNHMIPAQIKQDAYVVGRDLAATPGQVVFRNEVLELIQYRSTTSKVYRRPLLMVAAMINKYYAVDLSPGRSFVEYALSMNFQVFAVSWRNPTRDQAAWGVEMYALAVREAIEAIKSICRVRNINLYSICSGGMVCSALSSYLQEVGDRSIYSLTAAVSMLEMKPTDLEMGAFLSPKMIERIKRRSRRNGVLAGPDLAKSMLWMRPRDLVWGNVVNNYLMGNEPPVFDLLHWNNDWTSLPAELHCDFLDMFNYGSLVNPGGMQLDGVSLDLGNVSIDKLFIGGVTDHITPWTACYRAATAFGGRTEFVLSKSGHIQTLINSPSKRGASYLINPALPRSAEKWLTGGQVRDGSWWLYWAEWLGKRSSSLVAAPGEPGNTRYPALMNAPGSYVYQMFK